MEENSHLSFVKKSDAYSDTMAKSVDKALFSDDTFVTMRFSNLQPDEVYSNVMAYGNARFWLYTGIMQWEKMVDTLEKWKKWKEDPKQAKPEEVGVTEYKMSDVEDIIKRWHGCDKDAQGNVTCDEKHIHSLGYDPTEQPFSKKNLIWVMNHGWRYNRSLMFMIGFFDPVHTATLNTRYAVNDRTFKAVVELGKAERGREETVEREEDGKKKGWMKNPFKK